MSTMYCRFMVFSSSDRVDSKAILSNFAVGSSFGSDKQGYSDDKRSHVGFSNLITYLALSRGVI